MDFEAIKAAIVVELENLREAHRAEALKCSVAISALTGVPVDIGDTVNAAQATAMLAALHETGQRLDAINQE